MSSSEEEDAEFDAFLASLKPVKKEKYCVSSGSLDDFIVNDSHLSFGDSSFQEDVRKTCDEKGIWRKKRGNVHKSYVDKTDDALPIHTNDIEQTEKILPRSTNCDLEYQTGRFNSTGVSNQKIGTRDDGVMFNRSDKIPKSHNQNQREKISSSNEPLSRKLVFSQTKGNWNIMKNFTPKRSTASSNSVICRPAFSTPRIIFSSDSDSDEDSSGSMNRSKGNIQDDYIEKPHSTTTKSQKEIDNIVENQGGIELGNNGDYADSIECLCSDFDEANLDCVKSFKESMPETSTASPLIPTKKRSKILIYSDDSESDDDVIYVESDDDKENSGRNVSNRGLSSNGFDNDSVFFTPTPIKRKTDSKPTHTPLQNKKPVISTGNFIPDRCSETDSNNVFLTPTQIRNKTTLKPTYTPLHSTKAPYFKTPASMQKKALIKKDGLPENLPRNCETGAGFKRHRDVLTKSLYEYFNKTVFEGKLPKDMIIEWDKRLLKTAGTTKCSTRRTTISENGITCIEKVYSARICLSYKVLDTLHRLRDTLCHEMCHAAVWLIDHQSDGHGPFWKGWARKVTAAHPEMPIVRRCHSYDISYKFHYQCTMCRKVYGRHSKSIKIDKQVCGLCKGRLVLLPPTKLDGTPIKVRTPNKFAMFVKENYKIVQKSESVGGVTPKHSDVMKALSRGFASLSTKN